MLAVTLKDINNADTKGDLVSVACRMLKKFPADAVDNPLVALDVRTELDFMLNYPELELETWRMRKLLRDLIEYT